MNCKVIEEFEYNGITAVVGSTFSGNEAECLRFRAFLDCSQEGIGKDDVKPEDVAHDD